MCFDTDKPRFFYEEIIADEGEYSTGIYFIMDGVAGVSHSLDPSLTILNLGKGSFFGENLVLDEPFRSRIT